jgi:hypothetical protein
MYILPIAVESLLQLATIYNNEIAFLQVWHLCIPCLFCILDKDEYQLIIPSSPPLQSAPDNLPLLMSIPKPVQKKEHPM